MNRTSAAMACLALALLGGCKDRPKPDEATVAGLIGPNPVVSISHYEGPNADFSVESTLSIDTQGVVRLVGGQLETPPVHYQRMESPEAFHALAVSLGPYRIRPGESRTLAENSTKWLSDVGNQRIIWTYADQRQGIIEITNRRDDEVDRMFPLISVLDRFANPNWHIMGTGLPGGPGGG